MHGREKWFFIGSLLSVLFLYVSTPVMALTVNVVGVDNSITCPAGSPDCNQTPVNNYRWLLEEDKTYHVPLNPDGTVMFDDKGNLDPTDDEPALDPNWSQPSTLSVSFHHSYMPVVAKGDNDDIGAYTLPSADKPYFISVLPNAGYSIGGAQIAAGQTELTVYVNAHSIPTTQITVFVHEDIAPINNVWDLGEDGLEGFAIILEDAGGKYGASAGIQSVDAWGNPLCTKYQYIDANGNGERDIGEEFIADGDGNPIVDVPGSGCFTGPDGTVTVRNLAPGKYGIITAPPNATPKLDPQGDPIPGEFVSTNFIQTSTIEGTKLIDAWVKANEPAFFGEFGPAGPHVNVGWVPLQPDGKYVDTSVLAGGATITGQVVNLHLSKPPDAAFYSGAPFGHTTPWVGLNMGAAGLGDGIYAARTTDGAFAIPNVPPGDYQLVVWDDNLDIVFAMTTITVNPDGTTCNALDSCNLGDVPVFQWFTRMEHYVFNDDGGDAGPGSPQDGNGFWDAGELPLLEQNVNLRWRDGTVYQAFPTDGSGVAPFDQVFPFFSWLVSEVDFGRLKATGATIVADDGGPIPFGDPLSYGDQLTPQPQTCTLVDSLLSGCLIGDPIINPNTGNNLSRTETGPVLTQAFQGFLGQTSVVEWGKKAYSFGENGGISGMVLYALTRAEDDPEAAAAEPWEPGIPDVMVNLYDGTGTTLLATTTTDSWDASLPENCQYGANAGSGTDDPFMFRGYATDCFDGMRNWNQVRPGVFDGGYAFGPEFSCADDFAGTCPDWINVPDPINSPDVGYMKPGMYMVEVIPPTGYEVIQSEHRNVDFGDKYFPSTELLPPTCEGPEYTVPTYLTFNSDGENPLIGVDPADLVEAPLAGQELKTCNRKLVPLSGGQNAAADFFLMTEVPISAHFIGFILDDTANEFDPTSPQFGEKYAPPFLPVSIRDWTGREIGRTISDEYGRYNAVIPSTFTQYLPKPSGGSPNMVTTCMNAKTRPDGSPDPLHNPQYSQFCYTFQYMPGSTTYLDTPVVPVSAFAGADQFPLDCEYLTETPRINSVTVPANNNGGGPYMETGDGEITINSMGSISVPNPAYTGVGGIEPKTIMRDYGFGTTAGTVTLGGVPLTITDWANDTIIATAAGIPEGAQQLVVTRGDNDVSTITGVSVQVGLRQNSNVIVVSEGQSIQEAINGAGDNDLILVGPGTYNEMVIMWKPIQLQGWGEGSVTIDAIKTPFEKLTAWRILAKSLVDGGAIDLVDGQENGFGGIEPVTFFTEEGAGVFVVAKAQGNSSFDQPHNKRARIDGMTITGADTGGGVAVNGFADYLEISNLRVINNSAFFAGGIRIGHPFLTAEQGNNVVYSDADNDNIKVHHNTVTQNGGLDGAGGGIAMHAGSDSYAVTNNFVCGNFTLAEGAGIAHYGMSHTDGNNGEIPLIADNTVLFNENFNQGISANGGGILISGHPPFGCPIDPDTGVPDPACLVDPEQVLTPGSGSVHVLRNHVQGNVAGSGDGGGLRLSRINGQDVRIVGRRIQRVEVEYEVDVINNIFNNNIATLAGGGISLQDALVVRILHNTIVNNDNASVAADAFTPGIPSQSNAQPGAGIAARAHSVALGQLMPANLPAYSYPILVDNIVYQNRKFFWLLDNSDPDNVVSGLCPDLGDPALGDNVFSPLPAGCGDVEVYDDIAVLGAAGAVTCTDCIVTTDGVDPLFVSEYFNGSRETTLHNPEVKTGITAPPALDEGGNFIRLRFGPLTQTDTDTGLLFGDHHIQAGSAALDTGSNIGVTDDFDSEPRPSGDGFDIGADELQQ